MIKTFETTDQTSEALPLLFEEVLKVYQPVRLFFARGPGSFMAIKITYIFLKTLSIALKIPLLACDGFVFNQSRPIRAMRSLYFIKEAHEIVTKRLDDPIEQPFTLPEVLDETLFNDNVEPLYMLPAV
ncbi:hypothetical protein [Sulfurospirillum diekertiae]|uniref:hypothetical protein n=1 Tax=Sulfurospirillum diekertiae TaxID=1854492 RepID=UPI001E2B822F|nr:hypothetical protein [Sulfurospirillum diekertiae]